MKFIILALLVVLAGVANATTPVQDAAQLERDIDSGKLLEKTERAMNNLVITASGILQAKGFWNEAQLMETEWFDTHQHDLRVYAFSRGLGDFAPLSTWLKQKTDQLTFLLGVDLMKKTHLIDIVVFNHGIPVVFKPCNQPWSNLDEYRKHFSKDENFQGSGEEVCALLPVTSFWVSYGVCCGASLGTGFVMACGLAGTVVERLVCNFVSDGLSDRVFNRACEGL